MGGKGVAEGYWGFNWNRQPLGKISDSALAKRLGVSKTAVRKARIARGIPVFVKKGP